VIRITSAEGRQPPIATATVSAPRSVREIVTWIDQMKPVRPGAYSCPYMAGVEPTVAFLFRASAMGRVLARASETDYGWGSGPCNALSLTIPREGRRALVAGLFLERVERLVNVNLGFGQGKLVSALSAPGRPLSRAALARLSADAKNSYYVWVAADPTMFPSRAFLGAPVNRAGQFSTILGPGTYLLGWAKSGHKAACPLTKVIVHPGQTTHADVSVGCATR